MKFQALALSLLFVSHEAFIVPMTRTTKSSSSSLASSSQEPSIEALRAAAAKAREEAERLRQVRVFREFLPSFGMDRLTVSLTCRLFSSLVSIGIRTIDAGQ